MNGYGLNWARLRGILLWAVVGIAGCCHAVWGVVGCAVQGLVVGEMRCDLGGRRAIASLHTPLMHVIIYRDRNGSSKGVGHVRGVKGSSLGWWQAAERGQSRLWV